MAQIDNDNTEVDLVEDNSSLLAMPHRIFVGVHKQIFTIGTILLAFGATTLASGASVWDFPFARKTILDASKFFVLSGLTVWIFVGTTILLEWVFSSILKPSKTFVRKIYGAMATVFMYFSIGYAAIAFSYILHLNRCTWVHIEDGFCSKKVGELNPLDIKELEIKPDVPFVFSWLRNTFD